MLDKNTYYNANNISLGCTLEEACKMVLSFNGYHVEDHKVTDAGVDVKATSVSIGTQVIECLNWYGGYIHPKRFRSIVENLVISGYHEKQLPKKVLGSEYLISFGVKPTKEQYRLLKGYGIKVIHYHKQIKAITKDVLKFLSKALLGCYYYSSYYSNILSIITSSVFFRELKNGVFKFTSIKNWDTLCLNSNSIIKWKDSRFKNSAFKLIEFYRVTTNFKRNSNHG